MLWETGSNAELIPLYATHTRQAGMDLSSAPDVWRHEVMGGARISCYHPGSMADIAWHWQTWKFLARCFCELSTWWSWCHRIVVANATLWDCFGRHGRGWLRQFFSADMLEHVMMLKLLKCSRCSRATAQAELRDICERIDVGHLSFGKDLKGRPTCIAASCWKYITVFEVVKYTCFIHFQITHDHTSICDVYYIM